MSSDFRADDVVPIASAVTPAIDVRTNVVCLHEVTVSRPAVVAYLRDISADKHLVALLHLLDVGVAEVRQRRQLARHHAE